ncbi:unnamed protein product [Phaedon cochleariae]|uniref:Uncharacterized protein n=1 Tax=Phaedon cochleariae TaxID=80249 RepID=A0A9N9SHT8_PHACE|nr:unnamed protein product [Phaedon cochleariae]
MIEAESPELEVEDMQMVEQVLSLNENGLEQALVTQAHLLEETDINTVLSTIQVDEFSDFFTVNRNGEYEPSREEAEELEKALAEVDNDVKSLEKLSQTQGLLDSLMAVFLHKKQLGAAISDGQSVRIAILTIKCGGVYLNSSDSF